MDVCWFWCFLQEGEGDLYERMGEVHACGHLPQMSTCIFSNPHHNPSRLVSPPTSTQWHKATSSRPTASQLWLQSKSRLSSQKGHIPFCPEFLILSKVCQWDKVIVTEKDMPLSVFPSTDPLLVFFCVSLCPMSLVSCVPCVCLCVPGLWSFDLTVTQLLQENKIGRASCRERV